MFYADIGVYGGTLEESFSIKSKNDLQIFV